MIARSRFCTKEEGLGDHLSILDPHSFYCTSSGVKIDNISIFVEEHKSEDVFFDIHFRVFGGKGGFGSLLRSFRVNKSTNQLMCRDLNGRRLASIDEERKLRSWIEKTAQREKDKAEKRKQKYERLKAGDPKHLFNDPEYIRQKEDILDRTEEAFDEGFEHFKRNKKVVKPAESSDSDGDLDSFTGSRGGIKRKNKKLESDVPSKKSKEVDESSDSESDVDDEDVELLHEMVDYFKEQDNQGGSGSKADEPCSSTAEVVVSPQKPDHLRTEESSLQAEIPETIDVKPVKIKSVKNQIKEGLGQENFAKINLNDYESSEELEKFGIDHLKHALEARGLKCGGSLQERAARLYSVRDLPADKYPKHIIAPKKK